MKSAAQRQGGSQAEWEHKAPKQEGHRGAESAASCWRDSVIVFPAVGPSSLHPEFPGRPSTVLQWTAPSLAVLGASGSTGQEEGGHTVAELSPPCKAHLSAYGTCLHLRLHFCQVVRRLFCAYTGV